MVSDPHLPSQTVNKAPRGGSRNYSSTAMHDAAAAAAVVERPAAVVERLGQREEFGTETT